MILESLLAISLNLNTPQIPQSHFAFINPTSHSKVFAATFSSSRSSSFSSSRPSSSFSSSRPSSSFSSSRPSSSFSSTKSSSFSKPTITPKPSVSSPVVKAPSIPSSGVVRVNKQSETPKSPANTTTFKSTPKAPVVAPVPVQTPSSNIVTRETYVERYNDSGIMGNPFFWMYMFDNDRNVNSSQPAQVIVKSSDGEKVTVPESQLIVKKDENGNGVLGFVLGGVVGGAAGFFIGRKVAA